jgi:DNA adenine methylase
MLLRYPGGKAKIKRLLCDLVGQLDCELREPFFGSGAFTFEMLSQDLATQVWINDFDPGVAALWTNVIQEPDALKRRINRFIPTVVSFAKYKQSLLEEQVDGLELGFRKLAVHQMSYSGLGTQAGSPIGGWGQNNGPKKKYDVACRWSPQTLFRNIDKANLLLRDTVWQRRCTKLDFSELIKRPGKCFLYVDPPYYEVGNQLYQFGFSIKQHELLAKLLHRTRQPWLLSYNDHREVRKLYTDCVIREVALSYTINNTLGKKHELLICPRHADILSYVRFGD